MGTCVGIMHYHTSLLTFDPVVGISLVCPSGMLKRMQGDSTPEWGEGGR